MVTPMENSAASSAYHIVTMARSDLSFSQRSASARYIYEYDRAILQYIGHPDAYIRYIRSFVRTGLS